ncbi:MAG: type II toxin-antitoxin system RelE/ParE family toxin [Desulfomonile tiedjei]|nr:type II toxin-antitoxin system RelE/ParE family toxin [Desulfomonile tiedjei]
MSSETYQIELSPAAQRQIGKLPHEEQARLGMAIKSLEMDPRPPGSKKLKGYSDTYRLRIGKYRVLYDVYDRVLWVLILKVGHRKEVYRGESIGKSLRDLIERKLMK